MISYFTFMIFAIWFIISINNAGSEHREGMDYAKIVILATLTLILWCIQVGQAIIQFVNDDSTIWEYFKSMKNIGDIICLTLTPALCFTNYDRTPSMAVDTQAYISAIVSF